MGLSDKICGKNIDLKQCMAYLTREIEKASGKAESKYAFLIIQDYFCFIPTQNVLRDKDIIVIISQAEINKGLSCKRWDAVIEKITMRVNKFNQKGNWKNGTKNTQNNFWDGG